ncbi:adenylate/guanylate cyclase domain-containing protein [Phenylobacterium sp.]|uniref:adenylate/guanylate cyclase domain-containing protein n=1 Tax=Phenylobacterium sp. TaxID=1871053 RepID=UPI002CA198A8|nr:adenylate/guanylate cyclase domain-containing protein [Phenylobacterium sp.]HLZ73861.1 adenylate/guanylate cyclase domain-containing protein [Phenylobacterium sp.]
MTAEPTTPSAAPAATRPPGAASPLRRFALAVLLLTLLAGICAPFFIDPIARHAPQAHGGQVSFARWGPLSAPIELKGEWRMVWRSAPAPGAAFLLPVPGPWAGRHMGGPTGGPAGAVALPELGAASYQLRLRDLPAGHYALYVRQGFHARRILVDGKVISEVGRYAAVADQAADAHRAQEVSFDTDGADVDLAIDVANFHHRDNGLSDAPILGLADPMARWIALDWLQSVLLVSALLLLAAYGLVVFLFRPRERASLYFGVSCLLLLPFGAQTAHDDLIALAAPALSLNVLLAGQYLTSAACISAALAYVRALYPRESPAWPYWILQALNAARLALYVGLAFVGDTVLLSRASQYASAYRTIAFVCMLIAVIAACVRRRDGAMVFLFGLGSFVLALIYTDVVANADLPQVLGHSLVPVASLLLLFSQLVILAERWSGAIDAAEQSNMDLRRLLDINISISSEMQLGALLKKIVSVTSAVIHADRSSLFLHDERANELASAVAEGVEGEGLRFPADAGLAGWSFTQGQAVNLPDAYADPRFNRAVDAATGYRTRSVLTVPVTTRDGRRVGVMQALNHQDRASFGEGELERMSAFAAQAAIAIENATLFTQVAAERNYNESILSSMSSGVITLDREARVAKLNPAASAILRVSPEAAEGASATALLTGDNAWLMDEIVAVSAGGQPKTLLDADVRTVGGEKISANLSIVPLRTEQETAGLLIIIEDITQGKRLQGAMRRFMSQSVVDQVLGREDEVLFGSACDASVLFADIRGFTSLAERLEPRDTVAMLNEIFTELFEAVAASDGMLDKFIGDALMAVYGAPLSSGRDAQNAVESALAMQAAIAGINAARKGRGQPGIALGIGIASGEMVAGAIGSPKRMDYTVIGDSVNLAARLETATKDYGASIIVCEDTAAACQGVRPLRELDTLRVRGRERPARIFQVLTAERPVGAKTLAAYARGRAALADGHWIQAAEAFEDAVAADPTDGPSLLMLQRAQTLVRQPPPADWDGVWAPAEAQGKPAPA